MPRSERITVSDRTYTIWFADDPPERQEAVTFFQTHAAYLWPNVDIPPLVETMSVDEANEFLRAHPVQQQWHSLRIRPNDPIADQDLLRLQFLPELEEVYIKANITDEGVHSLLLLPALRVLVLYSNRITNGCLESVRRMRSLRIVDFQASQGVSRTAFEQAISSMNPPPESWAPFNPTE